MRRIPYDILMLKKITWKYQYNIILFRNVTYSNMCSMSSEYKLGFYLIIILYNYIVSEIPAIY